MQAIGDKTNNVPHKSLESREDITYELHIDNRLVKGIKTPLVSLTNDLTYCFLFQANVNLILVEFSGLILKLY